MNTWNVWDATKLGLLIAGLLVVSNAVMADETDGLADYVDARGDRINRRMDRKGDRVDQRQDKRSRNVKRRQSG